MFEAPYVALSDVLSDVLYFNAMKPFSPGGLV